MFNSQYEHSVAVHYIINFLGETMSAMKGWQNAIKGKNTNREPTKVK